jgi:hypothetical protein
MERASGVLRLLLGWFYSTDFVDIGIKMSNNITFLKRQLAQNEVKDASELMGPFVYLIEGDNSELKSSQKKALKSKM